MSTPAEAFFSADVGGTHVRVGLLRAAEDAARPVQVLAYEKYECAQYPDLGAVIAAFLQGMQEAPVRRGVIASAGFALEDGTVISANLPWPLSPRRIQQQLGLLDLRLVNDFEAVAHAAALVGQNEVLQITGPAQARPGPTLVLGPGTGLGAAVWIPTARRPFVLATEAGHAALSVGTELELALLGLMLRGRTHVPAEHALSGPGLVHLYRALGELRGVPAPLHTPAEVTSAAMSGQELARDTLQVFCGLLGSAVGDMALLYGVTGGVYLAGGFLPRISDFLMQSSFVARFLDKGPMRAALEQIPVHLVEHGQLGVLGAAHWYLGQSQDA